jgi:hypothetical protein
MGTELGEPSLSNYLRCHGADVRPEASELGCGTCCSVKRGITSTRTCCCEFAVILIRRKDVVPRSPKLVPLIWCGRCGSQAAGSLRRSSVCLEAGATDLSHAKVNSLRIFPVSAGVYLRRYDMSRGGWCGCEIGGGDGGAL